MEHLQKILNNVIGMKYIVQDWGIDNGGHCYLIFKTEIEAKEAAYHLNELNDRSEPIIVHVNALKNDTAFIEIDFDEVRITSPTIQAELENLKEIITEEQEYELLDIAYMKAGEIVYYQHETFKPVHVDVSPTFGRTLLS